MSVFHKLTIAAVLSFSVAAWAQQEGPPPGDYPQAPPPPQYQDQQQQQPEGYPPPDNGYQGQATQYGYMGPHPIPYDIGSGYCYQQGAHFHEYPPFDQNLFRESNGWFYFVGDPADFGYTQTMWGYHGHHPIPAADGGGYCFMDWPHRHPYPPTAGVVYNYVGGYYVYGGPFDPWYWRWRPHYAAYYGGYYRSSYYGGNYYRVRPAPIYRASVRVGAPGVYRAGAVAVAPGGVRVYARPAGRVGVVGAPPPAYRAAPGQPYRPGAAPGQPYHPGAPGPRPGTPAPGYRPAPGPAYHPAPEYHPTPAPGRPAAPTRGPSPAPGHPSGGHPHH